MRAKGRFAVIFFVAAAAVSVALFVGAGRRADEAGGRVRASRAGSAAPGGPGLAPLPRRELSPALARARVRALRSASEARGLAWAGEPGMTELTGWEYGTRARELTALLGGGELGGLSRLAAAGGLLPEGTDLAMLAAGFAAASSSAIYSPHDKQVLLLAAEPIRSIAPGNSPQGDSRQDKSPPGESTSAASPGESASPSSGEWAASGESVARRGGAVESGARGAADESLLAHEFTHALQDQHFGLLKLFDARPYDFDRTEAVFAVVEGDAMNVQRRLEEGEAFARRPLEEVARLEDERFGAYRQGVAALFPPLLTETFVFRYRDGARLVETARRRGGARGVDELFRRPPASSEQVLHPEKYFAGERPLDARADEARFAAAGWRVAASTPLGEIGVRGLLLKTLARREAERAAAGWGGDRAYLFEREGGAGLFVWTTRWDTAEDAREFFRAYNATERAGGASHAAGGVAGATDSERAWSAGDLLTVVRAEGDAVVVLRGREADVRAALRLMSGL
jgi:hypothetical protein